ncbi:hypothetical protein ACWT_3247 [Actinoplanes sp. SE50]|uniref:hypothetical protein n=1 Tax=unclassified Actinoplanes TaxID=2626549 RepID=UPI00023ECB0E|nr:MULTISPECIES: hypothetical protein [unclassified Actinoplanes]AEV84270.1 hypothetical protein ACPL_3375 [Actinoplanes sp. SE50/110]ATO82662.1 hypothetical protein ACWT_3247 [Actinoplanes sp. SE50]SLM00069.1 uncharacterized protein ACSP50_3301 [Actinoplanes sp. SE50/110]
MSSAAVPPGTPQPAPVAPAELIGRLRPFVLARAVVPAGAAAVGEMLPGLVATLGVDMGGQVNFVPTATVEALGGLRAAWKAAVTNLTRLPAMSVGSLEATAGHPDSVIYELHSTDPFGASRVCHLDGLLATAKVAGSRHGLLVALPTWYTVLLHVLTGPGVLAALNVMGKAASAEHAAASGPKAVSPDVFFVNSAGKAETVVYSDSMDGLVVNTNGLIKESLFGPGGLLPQGR